MNLVNHLKDTRLTTPKATEVKIFIFILFLRLISSHHYLEATQLSSIQINNNQASLVVEGHKGLKVSSISAWLQLITQPGNAFWMWISGPYSRVCLIKKHLKKASTSLSFVCRRKEQSFHLQSLRSKMDW